jgi:Arc/MetJ-type ribon-helix-helix transcriptional regulator
MSKAENFTVRMGEDLKRRMKEYPEINWSHVIREHVQSMLEDIEHMNELAADSHLSEEDVEELAAMIDAGAAERAREDLEAADSEAETPRGETDGESPQRRDLTDVDAA